MKSQFSSFSKSRLWFIELLKNRELFELRSQLSWQKVIIDRNKSGFSSLAIFNKNGTECFLTMSCSNSLDSGRRISKARPKSSLDPIIDVFTFAKFSK